MTLGLGCMRLSTRPDRDDECAVAVIRAALDAGATMLDSSDAYCLDDDDAGHNERLIARALDGWTGDRSRITIATKGGMRRPGGAWTPDGRAKHLRDACDASRRALGVDVIDLYQLHVVDPKTPIETSVRALAKLKDEGKVRAVGLCNVTVGQLEVARAIVEIAAVQVSLSPFDDENLRNGVAEYARDNGIQLIAYRPLGGERVKALSKNVELCRIAEEHGSSREAIVLAWLTSFGGVTPIPGATRVETAAALAEVLRIDLDASERDTLDAQFAGRLLRVPRADRRPRSDADGDVVLVMGMPGAGKTTAARALESDGYDRLNRDTLGGSLSALATTLDETLAAGQRRVVLDNTYPTRKSRNEVIETAWRHGVPVRCVWLATSVADAQINSIYRMFEAHGSLPSPEDIRERGRKDTRYLQPDAQFRYERTLEAPSVDEGFVSIEHRQFARAPSASSGRAIILDFDDVVGGQALRADDVTIDDGRWAIITERRSKGWHVFVHAWRPQIARRQISIADVDATFTRLRELLGADVDVACCPHDAGPPVCWCRKPIPGSVIEFSLRRDIALEKSIVIGASAADKTMAERIGARFETSEAFWPKD